MRLEFCFDVLSRTQSGNASPSCWTTLGTKMLVFLSFTHHVLIGGFLCCSLRLNTNCWLTESLSIEIVPLNPLLVIEANQTFRLFHLIKWSMPTTTFPMQLSEVILCLMCIACTLKAMLNQKFMRIDSSSMAMMRDMKEKWLKMHGLTIYQI